MARSWEQSVKMAALAGDSRLRALRVEMEIQEGGNLASLIMKAVRKKLTR